MMLYPVSGHISLCFDLDPALSAITQSDCTNWAQTTGWETDIWKSNCRVQKVTAGQLMSNSYVFEGTVQPCNKLANNYLYGGTLFCSLGVEEVASEQKQLQAKLSHFCISFQSS